MKRKIKFRAYDKGRKEYLSAGHIFLQINAGRNPADCVLYLDLLNNPNAYADRFVIERFTGLHDKAKKPIYEGDIVKTPLLDPIFGDILSDAFDNAPIEFSNGSFVVAYYKGNHKIYLQDLYDKIEVIGSIHDTPELLNEKEI